MTQISRFPPCRDTGQAGGAALPAAGRQGARCRGTVGLGVSKPGGPGGPVPARLVAHPLPAFAFRTVKIDVYDWDRDGR